jgi:NADH-quinone oxidoreductase subunit N
VKLLLVLLLTIVLELVCNFTTFANLETFYYFSSMLVHSPLIYCMKLAIRLFAVMVVAYINEYESAMSPSTMLLIGTTIFFMQVLVSANNFIVLYVALEGISLLRFVLTAQPKTASAVEAGLKYFVQSSFASIRLLLGIAIIFAATRDFNFLFVRWSLIDDPLTELTNLGLLLVTVAFRFKVSAFPGHFWGPDVYRGPLTSVVNFFAVVVKMAAVFAIVNLQLNFLVHIYPMISPVFLISSGASMVIGLVGALKVINHDGQIRSFVAYTSINQVGFILLGLVCVNLEGVIASLVYRTTYLVSSVRFIGLISRLRIGTGDDQRSLETFADLKLAYKTGLPFGRRLDRLLMAFAV